VVRADVDRGEALARLVTQANASLDPRRVAEVLVGRASAWLPMATWAVLADEWMGRPTLLASRGLTAPWRAAVDAAAAQVFRLGGDWLVGSVAAEIDGAPDAACVALALPARGHTRAALVGLDDRPAPATPRLTRAARALLARGLDPLACALDSAVRVQRAEGLSVTDDLTQLYNSRYLAQALRRESKRVVRSKRALSVLFIDIDSFKDVNDRHGHLTGSRALVEVAEVLRHCARETDVVARFGGDEFSVVLPDTDAAGAYAVAERVRDRIAAHAFLRQEGLEVRLTVSVGIATLPGEAASPERLLQAADAAMYWVKERGKNGIHVAPALAG
jgi:diguanylate cyclase (GGDEF)-like protein